MYLLMRFILITVCFNFALSCQSHATTYLYSMPTPVVDEYVEVISNLNENDQVVTYQLDEYATLWDLRTNKETYIGEGISASSINNSGQVSCDIYNYFDETSSACIWDASTGLTIIDESNHSWSSDINDLGQVVGSHDGQLFIWDQENGMKILKLLNEQWTRISRRYINNAGQIAGTMENSSGEEHAFIWEDNKMTDIRYIGRAGSVDGLNNNGQVAGTFTTDSGNYHAFIWDNSKGFLDLGTLGGEYSRSSDINDLGQIVGWSDTDSNESRAFIWDINNGMIDFQDIIKDPQKVFSEAESINNHGNVLLRQGFGYYYFTTPIKNTFKIDAGEINITHKPVRVNFNSSFSDPVIIANMTTKNGSDPCILRIYDIDSNGFTLQIQEYEYLNGLHMEETVNFLVFEAGVHKLEDGSIIEANNFNSNATSTPFFKKFDSPFSDIPVLMTSIVSKNGRHAVTDRVSDVSISGFDYRMQEQEASLDNQLHRSEVISYVAWEPGSGKIDNLLYKVGQTPDSVNSVMQHVYYESEFKSKPFVFADMQTTDGSNTASLAIHSVTEKGLAISVVEEQSKDTETRHLGEKTGYIAILGQ